MKYNNSNLYVLWSVSIILGVLLSLFSLVFASLPERAAAEDGITIESEEPEDLPEETQEPEETPPPVRLTETADAGREYLDKIIFLGDSTTKGIGYYYENGFTDLCPMSQVWVPANGTLTLALQSTVTVVYNTETGEEISIAEAAARAQPEYLLITVGINDVQFSEEEYFVQEYINLIKSVLAVSPDTKVICNSIFPVAASYSRMDLINNQKIMTANGWIEKAAKETGARFLNSYEAVVGPDGYLPEESQSGDGLHLTGDAYGKVMTYIRTHAYQ